MGIDRKTVDHVAWLARLALTDDERERLREQLSSILEHINVMSEADTSEVPATAYILPVQNVVGADVPWTSLPTDELLANAPDSEEGYIRVRAIFGEE
ncbi:MAG TPA: Asp-tRNA(Asn)/Glu-tRNA(Gln) amidotransferase subunit GatC [Ktedonobacterales bacterium]